MLLQHVTKQWYVCYFAVLQWRLPLASKGSAHIKAGPGESVPSEIPRLNKCNNCLAQPCSFQFHCMLESKYVSLDSLRSQRTSLARNEQMRFGSFENYGDKAVRTQTSSAHESKRDSAEEKAHCMKQWYQECLDAFVPAVLGLGSMFTNH